MKNIFQKVLKKRLFLSRSLIGFLLLLCFVSPIQVNASSPLTDFGTSLWNSYNSYVIAPLSDLISSVFYVSGVQTQKTLKPTIATTTTKVVSKPPTTTATPPKTTTITNTIVKNNSPVNYVTNTYPTTTIYQTTPNLDTSSFVSQGQFNRQVDIIFNSVGQNVQNLSNALSNSFSTNALTVNGNLTVTGQTNLNTIPYTWPNSQGVAGSILQNSGTGTLTWATLGAASVTPNSLDFTQLKDALTLDASTDIAETGTNVLSITNTGTGNSFVVNDQASDPSPFIIDNSGNVTTGGTINTATISGGTLSSTQVNSITTANIVLTTGSYADPTFITSLSGGKITGNILGNAGTATALAATPTGCSANQYANAIAASGNLTCSLLVNADIPSTLTGKTYNGLTINTTTGTLSIANLKTLTASNTLAFSGTDGSTLNVGTGGTLGTNAYTSTAYAPLASPTFTGTVTIPSPFTLGATSVTSTGTQLNYLSSATGTTGTTNTNLVFSTSPTLITPNLGVATATSINGNTITTGTGTLTLGSVTLNAGTGGTLGSNAFTSTAYLKADGTTALTGNWNMGAFSDTYTKTGATAATAYDAFIATNSTTASFGNQMYGGYYHSIGQGWATTPAASQPVDFRWGTVPVQGAAAATGIFNIDVALNAGAYSTVAFATSGGFFGIGNGGLNISPVMMSVGGTSATSYLATGTGLSFYSYNNNNNITSANVGSFNFVGDAFTATSGAQVHVRNARTFSPTSGTAIYTGLYLLDTINQTGGANGITRGIYINPTLTAAADYRSLEIANNSGYGIYQSGVSAINYFAGAVGIGTTSPAYLIDARRSGDGVVATFTSETGANREGLYITTNVSTSPYVTTLASSGSYTGALAFANGASESMRILGNGNVGIGTTAPNTKLDVAGTLTVTNASATPLLVNGSASTADKIASFTRAGTEQVAINGDGTLSFNSGSGKLALNYLQLRANGVPVYVGQNSNNAGSSLVLLSGGSLANGYGDIVFSGGEVGGGTPVNLSTLMTIKGTGNVGISNTAPGYLLHVGSSATTTGTTVARFENAGGTCDVVPSTTGGITCSSDMNLKKNITNLEGSQWSLSTISLPTDATTLDKVLALTPVTYNWNAEGDTDPKHTGFIAQDVQQIFPDLVSEDKNTNLLSLNYTGLIPYTIQAIQDMNLKINGIADLTKPNTFRDTLVSWFGNVGNGIQKFFAKEVHTDMLCVDDICVTRDQFKAIVEQAGVQTQQIPVAPLTNDTEVTPAQDTTPITPDITPAPATSDQTTPPTITPPPPDTLPVITPPVEVTPPTVTPPVTTSTVTPSPSTTSPVVTPPTTNTPPQDQSVPPVVTGTPDTTSSPQVTPAP